MEGGGATRDRARWRRHERVLWREAPGELAVVLGPDGDSPISLRGGAAILWRALARPGTVDELARRLAERTGAEVDVVRADIEPVIADLAATGALRRES